jgi:peptidoglycan-associated lipoprotein
MIEPFIFRLTRNFSIVLACAALAACASTQRSNSGLGDQPAAPISDSSQAAPTSEAVTKPADANSGTGDAKALPSTGDSGNADAIPVPRATAPQSENAVSPTDAEQVQMKRQLAEQEAEIDRLRNDREAEAAQREQQALQERSQQAVEPQEQTAPRDRGTGAVRQPDAARPSKQDEDIAAFPSAQRSAEPAAESPASAPSEAARSIYFGYDQSTISEQYDAILLENAAYLRAHPAAKFEVQGNCDERGSREYNLALGARRARAVKRALELGGADGSRIEVVSFGSEKPVANGKDEESYRKNRRVDIVY